MCVALPGVVKEIKGTKAVVDFSGNMVEAEAGLTKVGIGDRVLVHAGMILQKVSRSEAEELEELFNEIGDMATGVSG